MGGRIATAALAVALSVATLPPAAAPGATAEPDRGTRTYEVAGSDEFRIGDGDVTSEATFAGTQTLGWHARGKDLRFEANVTYARTQSGAQTPGRARYVSDLLPTGEQRDRIAQDPEYLSILNQPFSVRLDLPTLADLRRLRTDVPFDFPSPMTASTMHGRLRHLGEAVVDGRTSVGVGFAAAGTMNGALPDRPDLAIMGAIVLRGTAYYDAKTALLLASQTTVTIVGNVRNPGTTDAVRITYVRAIRAGGLPPGSGLPAPVASLAPEASAAPPQPTAVATP